MKFFISLLLLGCTLVACTSGNCRAQKEAAKALSNTSNEIPDEKLQNTNNKTKVWIYKYDGSLQCGQGKVIALADMQKTLGAIKVFNSESKMDNLMHVQACGTPTGRANVFEIDAAQLEEAKKKGFREWTFD